MKNLSYLLGVLSLIFIYSCSSDGNPALLGADDFSSSNEVFGGADVEGDTTMKL